MSEFAKEFLSMQEVARRLGVSLMSVRRMIERGELPVVRLGQRIRRVRAADLDVFVQSRREARQ